MQTLRFLLLFMFLVPVCAGAVAAPPAQAVAPLRASRAEGVMAAPASAANVRGEALEAINAKGYTYVRVKTAEGERWIVGPRTKVEVGDPVAFPAGMTMKGYHSEALDRDFESVDFVDVILVGDEAEAAAAGPDAGGSDPHGGIGERPVPDMDYSDLAVPEGGHTIADVYRDRTDLAGGEVAVRAKVVKVNNNIMQRNWLHLRDGTSAADGSNDLTVTSEQTAAVGDTVLVRGTLAVDKDFGHGYRYDVLVEEASVTVENGAGAGAEVQAD